MMNRAREDTHTFRCLGQRESKIKKKTKNNSIKKKARRSKRYPKLNIIRVVIT